MNPTQMAQTSIAAQIKKYGSYEAYCEEMRQRQKNRKYWPKSYSKKPKVDKTV